MKIVYKLMSILMIFSLLLSGCSKDNSEKSNLYVYYINKDKDDIIKRIYKKQTYSLEDAKKVITEKAPKDASPILMNVVELDDIKQVDNKIKVYLSKEFNELSLNRKNLIKACIIYNTLMIKGANRVEFFIDGKEEKEDNYYTLSSYYVMNDSISLETQRTDIILYLLDKERKKLVKTIKNIRYSKDKLEINTLNELILGPSVNEPELKNPFPQDFKIYSAKTIDGVCEVRMNNALNSIVSEKELKLAVYSIVNTLCSIPGIKKVQLYTNDEQGINFNKTKLYVKPLEKNDSDEIVIVPKTD